ncbi:MAG TPA: hypothetical protein DCG58_18455, partial [Hyphomonas adhaerens]|nr:hypothetical protein [Hyphomonas adhaerens]
MSETKSLFGRAAKFVQDKAKESKDAYDKRQLIQSLTELHGLRHHYENVLAEYDFHLLDREQLPEPAALADMDVEALRSIGGGSLQQILGMARAQEAKLVEVIEHMNWAHSRLYMLRDFSRNLSVDLAECGMTRSNFRPAIHEVETQARARGGAIGGGSAVGALISIEQETLSVPVARIPEEMRRYLTGALYLGMFRIERKATRESLSRQMLAIAVENGALDHISNEYQHEVFSRTFPSLLRTIRSGVATDIVRLREFAASDEYFAPHIAAILAGGEPDFSEGPDVPGLNRFLPEERLGKINANLVAALRGDLAEPSNTAQTSDDQNLPTEPELTDAEAGAALELGFKRAFEPGSPDIAGAVRAYPDVIFDIENVGREMLNQALAKAGLEHEAPVNADFSVVENYRRVREQIDAAVMDFMYADAVRPVSNLTQQEKIALFAATALGDLSEFSRSHQLAYTTLIAWGNGKGELRLDQDAPYTSIRPQSPEYINAYMCSRVPDYEGILRQLIERARDVATHHDLPSVREFLGSMLVAETSASQGTALRGVLDYLPADRPQSDAAVFLGLKDGQPVTFLGDESLLTIGAPGTGKTQGQVIPTLMTGTHSMVVLDIKGELLKTTQRDLEARGVRVLQFSLIDGHPGAHGYNPMTYLPNEPKGMWRKAAQMSEMLLPDELAGNGPWLANARTLLTCHACAVKLERGEAATLKDVMRSVKGGIKFVDG